MIGKSSAKAEVPASQRQRLLCAPKLPSEYGRLAAAGFADPMLPAA
jgi:hypothetical protein